MITYKDIKVILDNKLCLINDEPVDLTKKEYKLLVHFLKNKDKIFSRKELIDLFWEGNVSLRTIDTNITRLRSKLGPYKGNIVTRNGFGYGFNTRYLD